MSGSTLVYKTPVEIEAEELEAIAVPWGVRLKAYVELTKPKISALVLLTVVAGMFLGSWLPPSPMLMLHTLLGTALVAFSTGALNQWLERDSDALMPRTADRPLPSGRLSDKEVLGFAAVTLVAGVVYLWLQVNALTALLGIGTWALYVWVYTPLKSRTTMNTMVGAVGGALPALMGWTATDRAMPLLAMTLFMIVYLWQFPHFMAIAFRYRKEYAAAGLKMLPSVEPTGRLAGRQAVASSLALLPVSLLPALTPMGLGDTVIVYFAWALVLGLGYVAASLWFLRKLDEPSARWLLRASLMYLPAVMLLLVLVRLM